MSRKAKPYLKDGWYCTSIGGVQHQKLCRAEDGLHDAELALARLVVKRADAKDDGTVAPVPGQGIQLIVPPEKLAKPTSTLTHLVLDDYLAAVQVENAARTYDGYAECLVTFRERFGAMPIAEISYQDGFKWKKFLRQEKKWMRGKQVRHGLSDVRVNKCIRVAKTFFNWACKPSRHQKYGLTFNPFQEIKYAVEKPRERLITDEEFKHLLDRCTCGNVSGGKTDFREQLTVLRFTTMRPGELRKLRWEYILWDGNRIVFPPQVIKTKRRREVVMIPLVQTLLQERRERCMKRGLRPAGYVFPAPVLLANGKHGAVEAGEEMQQSQALAQRFRRLFLRCAKEGLIEREIAGERIVPYSTRHTRITELFREGKDQAVIMFEAGHVVPMTTERYKHLEGSWVAEKIRQGAPQMPGVVSSAGNGR